MELFWTDRYNADKKLWDKLITSKKGACPKICMLINPWFLGIEGVFTAKLLLWGNNSNYFSLIPVYMVFGTIDI